MSAFNVLCAQLTRDMFAIAKLLFIISYFDFGFTNAYNSILFCCLRRKVEPCCHKHDSRSTVIVYSARARFVVSRCRTTATVTGYRAWRLLIEYLHTRTIRPAI